MNKITTQDQALRKKIANELFFEHVAALYAGDDKKPVSTPIGLADTLVSKFEILGSNILVLSDLGLLYALFKRVKSEQHSCRIVFIGHTADVVATAERMLASIPQHKTALIGYNELQAWLVEDADMKFDNIVMNPPYGNLHLPILKKAVESLADDGICISIQPVRWLQDPLWRAKKSSDASKMQVVLGGKLEEVKVINAGDATKLFSAAFAMDLGIFTINKAGGRFAYDSLSSTRFNADLSKIGKAFFEAKSGFAIEHYKPTMKNFVPLMIITGALGSSHGYESCWVFHRPYGYVADGKTSECKYGNGISIEEARSNNKRASSGKLSNMPVKSFDTAEEAKNFFEFIKLESFRFFVYVTTLDVHIQCEYLPIPTAKDAFKESWTNEKYHKYLNLTDEAITIIKETMKNKTDDQFGWSK